MSADFGKLAEQVEMAANAGADMIHLDVIDGHFAPNISFGAPICKAAKKADPDIVMDVHLMITDPENFVDQYIKIKVDYISFHLEIGGIKKNLGENRWVYLLDGQPNADRINKLINTIRDGGIKPGLTLNPATEFRHVIPFLEKINLLMFMSVNPGFSGQVFIDSVYDKIAEADEYRKAHSLKFEIMVDGGVDLGNAKRLHDLGADILVSGSSFFKSPDYSEFVKKIKSL